MRKVTSARTYAPPSNGSIFYRGPSLLDGRPLVAIVTGLRRRSANTKTGNELQTWILRSDVDPLTAIQTGEDYSICGDCALRGIQGVGRECYVTIVQAPNAVYKAFKRRRYGKLDLSRVAGRIVRIGSYGDPAAVPADIWRT